MSIRSTVVGVVLVLGITAAAMAQVPRSGHVVVVAEENHSYASITSTSMPYLYSLATKYGLATNFYAVTHPSIGNYFMLTTGQIITNNDSYTGPVSADNIVRHMLTSGVTWKSYAESLPYAGYTGGDVYPYIQHHNPFSFFTDVEGSSVQKMNLVPFTQFSQDLANGTLPEFSFVVPNILDDAHDGTLAQADSWLQTNIAPLLANAEFQKDGLLIVWFDESYSTDTAYGGGHIFVAVIGPQVKPGVKVSNLYLHQNLLRTLMESLGMTTFPGAAATVSDMAPFFGTTSTTSPAVNIISPTAGSTVSSPVTVDANFSNGGTPQYMKLWVDGVAQYYNNNSTTLSYSLSLATGTHQIIVQAYNGALYSSSVNINVGTTTATPAVNIISPTAGSTVSSPVTVNASFSNGGTPQYMKLWVDGVAKYYNNNSTTLSYSLSLATGSHQIIVQAYNGTLYSKSENITVGTTTTTSGVCTLSTISPSVTICSPVNNSTVGTSVSVQAGSTDTASAVWLMQVYVDGYKQYEVQSNAVNTTLPMTVGTHRVTVQAYDRAGSMFKSTVYTTVQ